MNQVNPKATAGCLVVIAALLPVVSYWTVGSPNPLAVYGTKGTFAKILISVLAAWLALGLLQLFQLWLMRKMIGGMANRPAEDVICPGCGLPLLQFIGSHGMPVICPQCKRFWHNGPACYNRGMPQAKVAVPLYPCPQCRAAASQDQDLFDDEAFNRLR